jgi:hypothetical protein
MWDRYKKHFFGMQVVIVLFTVAMLFLLKKPLGSALTFFATMQLASVLGAYWGHRLRSRMQGRAW